MAVVHHAGTLRLSIRIEVEDDPDLPFFPVRALFVRVEQAQIGGEMTLVVGCQLRPSGGQSSKALIFMFGRDIFAWDFRLTPLTPPRQ